MSGETVPHVSRTFPRHSSQTQFLPEQHLVTFGVYLRVINHYQPRAPFSVSRRRQEVV